MFSLYPSLLLIPTLFHLCSAAPLTQNSKRALGAPALNQDFPDPAIVQVDNAWWAYGTTNGRVHVQLANSNDFNGWNYLGQDALPALPAWVNQRDAQVWAPDVSRRDDGSFLMYFSASLASSPSKHCVGAAISTSGPGGPFHPLDKPLLCPDPNGNGASSSPAMISSPGAGGAIDASGFRDTDGSRYLLFKVDGNSLGGGGACNNGVAPQRGTPIMLLPMAADGITPRGGVVTILDRSDVDGPLVEAPSLGRLASGEYALFYSSNCWSTPAYDVAFATSRNIVGPYVRQGQLLASGMGGLQAPGGASIAADGVHMVFHANGVGGRAMFTTRISAQKGGRVVLA